jgi:CubicO group peptidase (beta-lactamase class C family)
MIKVLFLNLLLSNSFFSFQKNNENLEINNINKINLELLNRKIDSIVKYSINNKAFPGAQILVMKDGKKVFNKNYGFHTYDSLIKVSDSSIYDIASLTKVTASTIALMKLYENGSFLLEKPLSYYLKFFKNTDKASIPVKDFLLHKTGLKPWIPFHETTKSEEGNFKKKTLSYKYSKKYKTRLTDTLFLFKKYKKEIYNQIKEAELMDIDEPLYSGLFFYLIPEIVFKLSKISFEKYVNNIYNSLELKSTLYKPLNKFKKELIVPTEKDEFFRMTQIHGVVHDEGAAMMDGVSGNAGIFSTANDLATIYQMFLNNGIYNNKEILKKSTINLFTQCNYCNEKFNRGLGFDKPLQNYDFDDCTYSKYSSMSSFGHSGYTGTFVWVDPEYDLIYIFLSNRVYKTRENRKLYEYNVRTKIHDIIFESFLSKSDLNSFNLGQLGNH